MLCCTAPIFTRPSAPLFRVHARLLARMRQMAKAPSAGAKALLDFGGGRANLVRTIALASGLILFLRPVLEAAVRERTMML